MASFFFLGGGGFLDRSFGFCAEMSFEGNGFVVLFCVVDCGAVVDGIVAVCLLAFVEHRIGEFVSYYCKYFCESFL